MTKVIKPIIFLLLLVGTTSTMNSQTKAHKDSLNSIVATYYKLNLEVFKANSSVKDIDKIFELFTDNFTYIHPKYGGLYTREVLYNGYKRNQKKGGYDGNVTDFKIINKMVGLNAVVVEKRFITKKDGEGASQMTLFEFKNGKISKIFEYW